LQVRNARNRGSAIVSSRPTSSGVTSRIAAAVRRVRGSVTPSLGSEGMTLSRTAARKAARTLLNRVLMVPGVHDFTDERDAQAMLLRALETAPDGENDWARMPRRPS
jgi:hypothetical protein